MLTMISWILVVIISSGSLGGITTYKDRFDNLTFPSKAKERCEQVGQTFQKLYGISVTYICYEKND